MFPAVSSSVKIHLSSFAQRRDQKWCQVPLADKMPMVESCFPSATKGYRNGVLVVTIPGTDFLCPVITLKDGDKLDGAFERRKENEEPRKNIKAVGLPSPAVEVDVILYHRDVLAEGQENEDLSSDYEVVTFLPKAATGEQPMTPETLIANHFLFSGGTCTGMNDSEFVSKLRESVHWWKDKAIVA